MKTTVAKFGGSSVTDGSAMKHCAQIVLDDPEIRVVVISATLNTTNMLEQIGVLAATNQNWQKTKEQILIKHIKIAEELGLNFTAINFLRETMSEVETLASGIALLRECSLRAMDRLYSVGERLSSYIFTQTLEKDALLVDAKDIIRTNSHFGQATPNQDAIFTNVQLKITSLLQQDNRVVVVTQGFIGADSDGVTTTLGREGSDYSAALIAGALKADKLQIWSDVPGIFTADPKIHANAKKIDELSMREAAIMASLGAKILFPQTLLPVMEQNIPLFVGHSQKPLLGGTWIKSNVSKELPLIRAITAKDEQKQVTLTSKSVLDFKIFIKTVIDLLHQVNIDYDFFHAFCNTISFVVDRRVTASSLDKLSPTAQINITEDLAVISLVGNNLLHQNPNKLQKIMQTIGSDALRVMPSGDCISILVPQNVKSDYVEQLLKEI